MRPINLIFSCNNLLYKSILCREANSAMRVSKISTAQPFSIKIENLGTLATDFGYLLVTLLTPLQTP